MKKPRSPEVFSLESGSSAGAPRFFAGALEVSPRSALARPRPPRPFQRMALQKKQSTLARPTALPTGLACHGGLQGDVVVDELGALSLNGAPLAGPPRGFVARRGINLGSDATGRVLLAGGVPRDARARKTDTWLFDGGTLTALATGGKTPDVADAQVVHDPARAVWLVLGGQKGLAECNYTDELDEKTLQWTRFENHFEDEKKPGPIGLVLAMRDSTSGQLVAVRWTHNISLHVYAYRGEGKWAFLRGSVVDPDSDLEDLDRTFYVPDGPGTTATEIMPEDEGLEQNDCIEGLSEFAWDDPARVIWGVGGTALVSFALGPSLDLLTSAKPPKPKEPKAKPPKPKEPKAKKPSPRGR